MERKMAYILISIKSGFQAFWRSNLSINWVKETQFPFLMFVIQITPFCFDVRTIVYRMYLRIS